MYARRDIERIFLNLNSLTDRLEDLQQELMPDSFHTESQIRSLRATLQHIERVMESETSKVQ